VSAEHVPVLFRGTTPEHASKQAKAWAKGKGFRVRTVATIKRRDDLPTWGADEDPYTDLYPFEVTLVLDVPAGATLPEPPTLWAGVQA